MDARSGPAAVVKLVPAPHLELAQKRKLTRNACLVPLKSGREKLRDRSAETTMDLKQQLADAFMTAAAADVDFEVTVINDPVAGPRFLCKVRGSMSPITFEDIASAPGHNLFANKVRFLTSLTDPEQPRMVIDAAGMRWENGRGESVEPPVPA